MLGKTWTCSLRTWIPTLTPRIMLRIRLIGMIVFLTLRILQDITMSSQAIIEALNSPLKMTSLILS